MRSMFPFSTFSQKVVPHFYVFGSGVKHSVFATLMALVLSHMRGTWEHSSPKSLSVYVIEGSDSD
jgi:hypothetical protein